jgi:repressor LexA
MMTCIELTDGQHRMLTAIEEFHRARGFAPTVRELQKAVGMRSSNTAHYHLRQLQALGLITWEPQIARTIRLSPEVQP